MSETDELEVAAAEPVDEGPRSRLPVVAGLFSGPVLALALLGVLLVAGRAAQPAGAGGTPARPARTQPEPADPPPTMSAAPAAPAATAPAPPREPTDAEAAEFAAAFRAEGVTPVRSVAQDANGDKRREIVVASLVAGTARIDVAAWDGLAYTVVATGRAGPADEITDLQVRDATGEGPREILLAFRGAPGSAVSIWGWAGSAYVAHAAKGGCMDGRTAFGVAGADVGTGRLTATCDHAQPPQTDAYRWDRRARTWTYETGS